MPRRSLGSSFTACANFLFGLREALGLHQPNSLVVDGDRGAFLFHRGLLLGGRLFLWSGLLLWSGGLFYRWLVGRVDWCTARPKRWKSSDGTDEANDWKMSCHGSCQPACIIKCFACYLLSKPNNARERVKLSLVDRLRPGVADVVPRPRNGNFISVSRD